MQNHAHFVCTVDYILMDHDERRRLHITWTPTPYPQRVIRAPIPWHDSYQLSKDRTNMHLFITNPMMLELQRLWYKG